MTTMIKSSNCVKYESKNPLRQYLLNRFLKNIQLIIANMSVDSLLDVGCGEGMVLKLLSKEKGIDKIVGIDMNQNALKLAKRNVPTANFRKMSASKIKFPDGNFDLVIMLEVLEHLKNPEEALREAQRVSNSYCLFSVPNEPMFSILSLLSGKYIKSLGRHPEHVNFWSYSEFIKLVSSQFSIEKSFKSTPWTIILAKK